MRKLCDECDVHDAVAGFGQARADELHRRGTIRVHAYRPDRSARAWGRASAGNRGEKEPRGRTVRGSREMRKTLHGERGLLGFTWVHSLRAPKGLIASSARSTERAGHTKARCAWRTRLDPRPRGEASAAHAWLVMRATSCIATSLQ